MHYHEHEPDPRDGWILLAILFAFSTVGLLMLEEAVAPPDSLFTPHYEEPVEEEVIAQREPAES
jgi:hypothetical protein